jgi:hypothetical protein
MMSEEKASNPHTKRGLVVGAAARVTLVVAAALAALIALPRARDLMGGGMLVGAVLATVGLPLLAGWLLTRAGRTSLVNPVIIAVAIALVGGTISKQRPDESDVRDALREVAERRRGDEAERVGAAPRAAAGIEKADTGDVDMQAMTRMYQRLHEPVEQLDALVGTFRAAGAIKAKTLDSMAAIDARREMLGRVRAQAELLRDRQKHFVADAEAELRKGGADPQIIEGFLGQARSQSPRLDAMLELRESDVRYYAICDRILTLLRDRFGAWRIDPKDGAISFDSKNDLAAFTRAQQELRDEIALQERLEAKSEAKSMPPR